jgi:hypothetical protein
MHIIHYVEPSAVLYCTVERPVAGLGLSGPKSAARRDHAHAHRHRLQNLYYPQKRLLNRLPTKVSFSIFDYLHREVTSPQPA